MPDIKTKQDLLNKLLDRNWRLNNLYYITNDMGKKILFEPDKRPAQKEFLDNLHTRNIILKSRQIGYTTLMCIFQLDACLFHPNTKTGIIAHTLQDAKAFFNDKIKFAFKNLPDFIKENVKIKSDNKSELILSNGSSIRVGTSHRSGTLNLLHISEYGKISARSPDKAQEILTGGLNTVSPKGLVTIESTAEGRGGIYYDIFQQAERMKASGNPLTNLDYKSFFTGWYNKPECTLTSQVDLPIEMIEYFEKIENRLKITLTQGQKSWYYKTWETQQENMFQEFPSSPEEAFLSSSIGSYYSQQMKKLRKDKRLEATIYDPAMPVYTAWDIGYADNTAITFYQVLGDKIDVIDFYENSGEDIIHYIDVLKSKPYKYETNFCPHDMDNKELISGRSKLDRAKEMGINFKVIPRTSSVKEDIDYVRSQFYRVRILEKTCAALVKCLDVYSKKFDKSSGLYMDKPNHDVYSNGADSFRYMIMSLKMINDSRGLKDFDPFPNLGGGSGNWMS